MSSISIKTFMLVAALLPASTSIMLRGPHGIGKSQLARQLADRISEKESIVEYEFIDRRLSQMSEGDVIGLPSTDGNVTRFNPPDWYKRACEKPCFLFLDELNRATPEVMQAAFQIVLDRELNGWKLHPQTRVMTAINASAAYNVNEVDPALLDRFWVADLSPTVEDFKLWGRTESTVKPFGYNCLPLVIDFIEREERFLDPPKDNDPSRVASSRRSWERLGDALFNAGLDEKPEDALFYALCTGYVGTESAIKFVDYAKSVDSRFTGEELLNDYKKMRPKLMRSKRTEIFNSGIQKLADTIHKMEEKTAPNGTKFVLTDAQGKNLRAFMDDLPGELKVSMWTRLMEKGLDNLPLLKNVHKHLSSAVCEVFGVPAGPAGVGVVPNIPGLFKPQPAKDASSAAAPASEKAAMAAAPAKK